MLVQMNQAAPPPHYGDYKYAPPPPSHHHHHHSHHAHHGLLPSEPQHDDFGEPDHNNGYAHAAHHHAHFAHNHPWTTGHGLAQFGAAFGSHHDYDDQDHDDHLDQDDEDDDSNNNPVNASSGIQSSGSRRSKSGTTGATNASSSKKETFMCPEVHCGKTFPRSFALRRHMRIHTGTKPYACDFDGCTQRFNTSGNLSRHKRIHSGERPYPCVFASCGKRFNTSTKLKRHMRIHFPDGQSLFHCVQQACVFACDNYKEYVHHQRQHGNPAYAAPPTPTHHDTTDENVDRSNLPAKAKAAKTAKTAKSAKTKTKKNAASDKIPQPRVSKASSAMAAATTAVLRGDFPAPQSAHGFDTSPSSSAASGLSLLMKEARDLDAEYSAAFDRSGASSRLLDRPRLPFPTGAFPSDSISGASPMNLASAFGNAYAPANAATNNAARYYDHTSSSSTSYLRGDTGYGHHQPQQPHYLQAHDGIHFPPLRPEDAPGDDDYDNDDATSPRHNSTHQGTHHHHNHHNHHGHRRGGDNDDADAHGDDDAKYGGYGSVPHAPGPEFTGEELSAVLELMKDS